MVKNQKYDIQLLREKVHIYQHQDYKMPIWKELYLTFPVRNLSFTTT